MISKLQLDNRGEVRLSFPAIMFLYIGMFILLYVEPLQVFGLKIGILWKLAVMAYCLTVSFTIIIKKGKIYLFVLFSILLAFKTFFSISSMDYPMVTIELFIENLFFATLFLYFVYRVDKPMLEFIGRHFSIFIILSFLPFILGILTPISQGYDLSLFGLGDESGLIGVFQKAHGAAIILAFALIMIFYYYLHEKLLMKRVFYTILIVLGMYIMLKTYVRTGLVMVFAGMAYLALNRKDKLKYVKLIITSSFAILILFFMYMNDTVMQMRMSDQTIYIQDGHVGSGRLLYWYHAVDNWYSEGFESIVIGLGQEYARELMYEDVHNKIFAHNGFIQILQAEGLIGIGLYVGFLLNYYLFIRRKRQSKYYLISMAFLIAYLCMMMFQGGNTFFMMLYLALFAALIAKDELRDRTIGLSSTKIMKEAY
ncbi:MAG: O-antigen ligase family protein [Sulfurovum sp.]|nr:O-antigen ligase family protein [Sulfurovum sp.]